MLGLLSTVPPLGRVYSSVLYMFDTVVFFTCSTHEDISLKVDTLSRPKWTRFQVKNLHNSSISLAQLPESRGPGLPHQQGRLAPPLFLLLIEEPGLPRRERDGTQLRGA